MPAQSHDIRYVCLSDMHLGEADSILTPLQRGTREVDATSVDPVLEGLVVCLEHLIDGNRGDRRPTLILNGDALELAFGTFSDALTNFERLARLLLERELFDLLVYIPGNHDHHIWEVARETQYGNMIGEPGAGQLPPLRHVTSLRLEGAVPAFLLNKIIDWIHEPVGGDHAEHEIVVAYPNLALLDGSERRCVLFHHGHYVEPVYHFFSKLLRWLFPDRPHPESIDEVEAENFAWIEFIWSLLGRSGGAGADVRRLFRTLRDPAKFDRFSDDLARRAVEVADVPWIPGDVLERIALRSGIRWLGPRLSGERSRRRVVFSSEVREGIESYLFGPTFRQLREELGKIPDELTFVFGHTHKPFEAVLAGPGADGSVKVYNTGGWPIDSIEPFPSMGASILLLNETLDVAALRVFNDGEGSGQVTFEIRSATANEPGAEFRGELEKRLRPTSGTLAEPWQDLESRIRDAVARRRRYHEEAPDAANR
ncbi:MAG: hypothetical protein GWN99_19335 [Gemmatimonadetes bacterium]|uniref:Calcineurin-like phosphoesterase domain-containing protein n=1 Tax=Candidatus Kutchimonas denitrificans TaxID=3056748 RepID=A0AAE4ZBQ3_9BACT|nr:hypothetical protein [Gemmatimonadota bacterium]NIR76372.1 hypothetical protein [Candidatus Kutchimonas denitrificans]NIS03182.1 hypothetical protein [Gemmatimonadota bacterium]NIT66355.1 hypothetical protein [Gemmatimonadota bacterium]NIU54434.1 hypothetical protein [Gemmatimonadota bacterium]